MEKSLIEQFDELIANELEGLSNLMDGDERSAVLKNLQSLISMRQTLIQEQTDEAQERNNEKDRELRAWTSGFEIAIEVLKCTVQVGVVILPLRMYDKWFTEGLIFEQEGIFNSQMVKGLIPKLLKR